MTFIRIRLLFKFVDAPARALWLHREKKSVQSSGIKRMWRKAFRISWKKVAQNTYILYECTDCTYSMCAQIRTLEWTHAASHKWLILRDRLICSVFFCLTSVFVSVCNAMQKIQMCANFRLSFQPNFPANEYWRFFRLLLFCYFFLHL